MKYQRFTPSGRKNIGIENQSLLQKLNSFILPDYWSNQHSLEYPTIGLYNLEEDPQELNNLAFQHPDLGM